MQIHLSDISSSEGMRIQKTAEFGMDTITFQSGSFPVLAKEMCIRDSLWIKKGLQVQYHLQTEEFPGSIRWQEKFSLVLQECRLPVSYTHLLWISFLYQQCDQFAGTISGQDEFSRNITIF